MLQNTRVSAFTVSELLKENQQGGGVSKITPTNLSPPSFTQIRVKDYYIILWSRLFVRKLRNI